MTDAQQPGNSPPKSAPDAVAVAKSRGAAISSALDRFYAALDAIRDLDENLTPRAEALDRERLSPAALTAVRGLTPTKQAELKDFFESKRTEADESAKPGSGSNRSEAGSLVGTPAQPKETTADQSSTTGDTSTAVDQPNSTSASPEDIGEAKEDNSVVSASPPDQAASRRPPDPNIPKLNSILDKRWVALEFARHLYRSALSPFREYMLRSSLFVTAFGVFEVLVGVLAREYFVANPGALGDEPRFTLKELESFETLDDARRAAISTRVDSLLQEDFGRWAKWFDERLNLKVSNLCVDHADLEEMFQRRHVIIHNEGRASRRYLHRLAGRPDLPALDDSLYVSSAYLERALDQLDTLGALLGSGAWAKLFQDEEQEAMDELNLRSYDLMVRARWGAVRKICSIARHAKCDASLCQVFKVNSWLAEKRLGNVEAITEEVNEWDVSALQARFRLAQLALLDELDLAYPLARELLSQSQVDERDVADWPLLQEFREDGRYEHLMEEHAAQLASRSPNPGAQLPT